MFLATLLLLIGCEDRCKLPILGMRETVRGSTPGAAPDTLYHHIPDFSFVNQDGQPVTQGTFAGKVYVADFFFTSCPSICPIMKKQMLRVYEQVKDNPRVLILSHSIDPAHDSVAVLKRYANGLGIRTDKWHLVTGDQDNIYEMAQKGYVVPAQYNSGLPQDISHSGAFVLVDAQRHIRGYYNGTDPAEVDKLLADLPCLLNE